MMRLQVLWVAALLMQNVLSFGQDSTRVFAPIPIFASSVDTLHKIAVISSSIPHFELSKETLIDIGATDIGDAVKYLPGILLKNYGGIGGVKTISYRGLASPHTNIMLDGNLILNTQSGSINLSSFELLGLEKLSFSSGRALDEDASASSYLQTNTIALNSVLNVKPKSLKVGVYGCASTVNIVENGAYVQMPLGKSFFVGTQIMARYGSGAYTYKLDDLPAEEPFLRENSALVNWRTRLVIGYQKNKHKATLSASYFNNEQELPGAVVFYNPSNYQKLWNEDLNLSLQHSWKNKGWKIASSIGSQSAYTRYLDPFFLNLQGFIDARYHLFTYHGGTMVSRLLQGNSLKLFAGSDVYVVTLEGNNTPSNPIRISSNSVLGATKEYKRLKIDGNLSFQAINDAYNSADSTHVKNFKQVSPFLSIAYLPFKNSTFKLRGFYKRTFRMPTFNDLYYTFIGNTNLKPEQGSMFDIGATYGFTHKRVYIEITADAFLNEMQNKIIAIPTKNIFNWSMQNIGEAQIKGTDLAVSIQYNLKNIRLQLQSNHSFIAALDKTNKNSLTYNNQLPYTPYYTNSSLFSMAYKGYKISTNVLFSGYRFSLNENSYENLLPSFTDLNAGLSKKFNRVKNSVLIDLKVMNIIGKNYQVVRSFPMPGRYLQLRLLYEFE